MPLIAKCEKNVTNPDQLRANSVFENFCVISVCRAIETYGRESRAGHFSANAFFHALLTFVKVFFGAFAIGSLMGCITALISFCGQICSFYDESYFVLSF